MNDVIHTALWTSNIERTEKFYTEGLGLERRWSFSHDGVGNVYIGGPHGEVQWKHARKSENHSGASRGLDHIAIGVQSVDDQFAHLLETFDPPVVTAPTTMENISRRVAFVEDPEGYVVELVERTEE